MKWVYLGLTVSFVLLSLLLFVKTEEDVRFGTQKQSYSWYYTDPLETVQIYTLINQKESHHVDIDYIEQLELTDDETTLSMELIAIDVSDSDITIDETTYNVITLRMRPSVIPTNTTVSMENASLRIHYRNGTEVNLEIGSVNYVFPSEPRTEIALTGLTATHELIDGTETVSAIQLGLKNNTGGLLEIRSIEVLSEIVSTNPSMMVRDLDCTDILSVTSCLRITEYSFFTTPIPSDMHELILPGQETLFYVPLSYQEVVPFHRFVIAVTYQIGGEEAVYYIDDFPFIRTTPFQSQHGEEYIWYVIDSDR